MAPAAGQLFTMSAEVLRPGRTLIVCRGEAFADDSVKPFAAMQATMTVVRGKTGISG
jgi:acyl-coenzyme A thioesterase PaaI-like protein